MPTRNVSLTEELDHFVNAKIATGRYDNASEVMRSALRALEREERIYEAKLKALLAALEEGEQSGDPLPASEVFAEVRARLGQR